MRYIFVEPDTRVHTWRTDWPALELRRRGYDVELWTAHSKPGEFDRSVPTTFIIHFINKGWQAPGGPIQTIGNIAAMCNEYGRLIMSVDDDWTRMLEVQPRPISAEARALHAQVPTIMRHSERIICATPRLAEVYGRWSNTHIVENAVPDWVIDMQPSTHPLDRIVWMGEMYLHGAHDWNPLMDYAADLPPLHLVGPTERDADVLRGWGARDVTTTNGAIIDQRKLYREMSRGVGAMIPISDTPFNRGKSWSKPLEFLARGLPVVAGWHAEYDRLNELTGAVPTFGTPAELVEATVKLWESRRRHYWLPERLRDAGLTMQTGGGDAWEKALI